jgi:hypothetical protein
MEWQPIETAPKDGTVVLLFVPGDDDCREDCWITASWDGLMGGVWMDNARGEWWGFGPSHWMPLPPPPKEQK